MSAVPPDELWPFLLKFFTDGDETALAVLADRLEEAEDTRGLKLRKRWRAQLGLMAKARAKGGHKWRLTEARLHEYVRDLFPECRDRYEAWMNEEISKAANKLRPIFDK